MRAKDGDFLQFVNPTVVDDAEAIKRTRMGAVDSTHDFLVIQQYDQLAVISTAPFNRMWVSIVQL